MTADSDDCNRQHAHCVGKIPWHQNTWAHLWFMFNHHISLSDFMSGCNAGHWTQTRHQLTVSRVNKVLNRHFSNVLWMWHMTAREKPAVKIRQKNSHVRSGLTELLNVHLGSLSDNGVWFNKLSSKCCTHRTINTVHLEFGLGLRLGLTLTLG